MDTKWRVGIGPMNELSSAIAQFKNSGWTIQIASNIGKYEKFEQAAIIVSCISVIAGAKAPMLHPGNEWHPVHSAQN